LLTIAGTDKAIVSTPLFLALKILMYTIAASTKELFLLLLVVIIGVLVFASMEYYMEIFSDEVTDFDHIPLAFWWALITMTTIGYGDIVPKTALGYIVGSMCAISGVLTIVLTLSLFIDDTVNILGNFVCDFGTESSVSFIFSPFNLLSIFGITFELVLCVAVRSFFGKIPFIALNKPPGFDLSINLK
jgi:lipid-A-disaccharide synthase-like uncharacterized protein